MYDESVDIQNDLTINLIRAICLSRVFPFHFPVAHQALRNDGFHPDEQLGPASAGPACGRLLACVPEPPGGADPVLHPGGYAAQMGPCSRRGSAELRTPASTFTLSLIINRYAPPSLNSLINSTNPPISFLH